MRPSLIDQWWHWGPLWNQTIWLPPPLIAKFQEEVYKVKRWLVF
jgi:hypothetical protein